MEARTVQKSLRTMALVLGIIGLFLAAPGRLVTTRAGEPSEKYKADLRKTIEKRREWRRRRGEQAIGQIVPYPMPPALIIRHTPETHDEIRGLLHVLRGL